MAAVGWLAWLAVAQAEGGDELEVVVVLSERGSGVPVAGATLWVEQTAYTSDDDGEVRFRHAPGAASVRVESPLYAPQTVAIEVGPDSLLNEVWLVRGGSAEEVTVFSRRAQDAVQQQTVSIEELRRVPGAFGDPIRALQSLPSVARPRSVEGALVVRGAEAANTGLYIDGVEVPFLFHLLAGKSVLSPSLLDRVDFYPGGAPFRFGDAAQAVMDARTSTEPPQKGGLHGDAHVDLLELGASVLVPLPQRWEVRLAGRASWLSGVARGVQLASFAATSPDDRTFRPAGFRVPYSDYYARILHPIGAKGRVSLTAFGADDGIHVIPELEDADSDGQWDPPEPVPEGVVDATDLLENHFARVVLAVSTEGEGFRQETRASVGRDHQRNLVQGLGAFASAPQDVDVRVEQLALSHDNRIGGQRFALVTGLDARLRRSELQTLGLDSGEGLEGPLVEDQQLWIGPYAAVELAVGPVWLSPGVRLAHHQLAGRQFTEVEPRASGRVEVRDGIDVHAFAGRFTQAPTADRYALSAAPVEIVRALQTGAGVQAELGTAWTVSADVYRTWFADLVVPRNVPQIGPGGDSLYNLDQGLTFAPDFLVTDGSALGAEVLVRRLPTGRWFGWLALSAGRSVREIDGISAPSDYDTPFDLTLLVARDLGKHWGASGRVRAGVGQPFTPLSGVYVSSAELYVPVSGAANSDRYPPFFQLDLRFDKTWVARSSQWTLYLDIFNATNTHNPLISKYSWDYTERQTTAWVPVLPTLGASVSY